MKRTLGIALALAVVSAPAWAEIQVTQNVYPDNSARVTLQLSFPAETVSQVMELVSLIGGPSGQKLRTEVDAFFAGSAPDPYASKLVRFLTEFGNALAGDLFVIPTDTQPPNVFRHSIRGWSDASACFAEIVYLVRDVSAFGQNNGFSTFLTFLGDGYTYSQSVLLPGNQALNADYPTVQLYLQETLISAFRNALLRTEMQDIASAISPGDEDQLKAMVSGVIPVFTKVRHTLVLPGNVGVAEGAMRREGRQAEWNVELDPYFQGQPLVFMADCGQALPEALAEKATFDADLDKAVTGWDERRAIRASRGIGADPNREPVPFNPLAPGAAYANLGFDALKRKDFNQALQYYEIARNEDERFTLGYEIAKYCAENAQKGVPWLSRLVLGEGQPTLGEYYQWDAPTQSFAAGHMPSSYADYMLQQQAYQGMPGGAVPPAAPRR